MPTEAMLPKRTDAIDGLAVTTAAVAAEFTHYGPDGTLRLQVPRQRSALIGGEPATLPIGPASVDLALVSTDPDVVALLAALDTVIDRVLAGTLTNPEPEAPADA